MLANHLADALFVALALLCSARHLLGLVQLHRSGYGFDEHDRRDNGPFHVWIRGSSLALEEPLLRAAFFVFIAGFTIWALVAFTWLIVSPSWDIAVQLAICS